MKASGAKGFSRVRKHRTALPLDEDRTCLLYTEGIDAANYESITGYQGTTPTTLPSEDPGQLSPTYCFSEEVCVRAVFQCEDGEHLQWSHDGVRWYDLSGTYRWFWPHIYADTGAMVLYQGRSEYAKYWRTKGTIAGVSVYDKRFKYETVRDPNLVFDHNQYDYLDVIGNDSQWGLNENVYHTPFTYNADRYIALGAQPEMGLFFLRAHNYSGAFRLVTFDKGRLMGGMMTTTRLKQKYQYTQLCKRGVTLGHCPWGSGSSQEYQHEWHPNSFFWDGFSLASMDYLFYAFKTSLKAGVSVKVIPPYTQVVRHELPDGPPDTVIICSSGPSDYETFSSGGVFMSSAEPTYYNESIGGLRKQRGVDAEYEVYDDVVTMPTSAGYRWMLSMYNSINKTVNVASGSYTGNGSAVGPVVDVGFRPHATILFESVDINSAGAVLFMYDDTPFDMYNDSYLPVYSGKLEHTSSGFDILTNNIYTNVNGRDYMYLCLGGHPEDLFGD